jgi:hypothetical protein
MVEFAAVHEDGTCVGQARLRLHVAHAGLGGLIILEKGE